MKLRNKTMLLAAAVGTLLLTNASQAAVTITFSEVGPDVVATLSGSLTTPNVTKNGTVTFSTNGFYMASNSFLWFENVSIGAGWGGGISMILPTITTPQIFSQSPGLGFGFFEEALVVPATIVPGQVYSPIGSVLFAGRTLVGLGVSGFDNTLAYTAVNGEQIFYTTNTTTVVPEPTVGVLWGLGMSAFLIRRRRRN